jgi:hypothetical protein
MSDPHKFFKTKEDYEQWEPYISQCDLIEGLSDDDKNRAKQAMDNLRPVLGENFLKRALREYHPLTQFFLQATSFRRVKLTGLSEAIEALKSAENFRRILNRIKAHPSKDLFHDGYSVLQTAYLFLKAGLQVCFVDERGGGKKPDIKLVDEETGEEIFVEVSTLNKSDAVDNAHRASWPVFNLIFGALAQAQLAMYAQMKQGFDEDYAPDAVKQLTKLITEVKTSGELREIDNNFIVAGIAPEDKINVLNHWAAQKRIQKNVAGPPIIFSELSRLQRKIREKLEEGQLPNDKPSILVIPVLSIYLFHFYTLAQIIGELEKQVNSYPNLLAILLSYGYVEEPISEVRVEELGPHIIIYRMATGFPEPIIILKNQAFALNISSSTLAKVSMALSWNLFTRLLA